MFTALGSNAIPSSPENLVFCINEPIWSTLPSPERTTIVPLRSEIPLLAHRHHYVCLNLEELTSAKKCQEIKEHAVGETRNYQLPHDWRLPRDYLWPDLFPVLLCRSWISSLVNESLKRHPNDRIWIPSVQRQKASQRHSDCDPNTMEVIDEMRYLVLAESLSGVEVSRFRESQNLPNTPQLKMRLTRQTFLEAVAYFTFKKSQKFVKYPRSKPVFTPQPNSISIACQRPKVRVLTDLLLSRGIAINFIELDALAAKCRSCQTGSEKRMKKFPSSTTSTTLLNNFVNIFGYRLQELLKELQTNSSDFGSMLITDREYDGVGRTLIDSFCKAQKKVFLVPEGATYSAEQIETNAPFFQASLSRADNSSVTRCVVSETALKQERRKNPEQEIVVSGYLGQSSRRFLDVFGTKLLKLWIKFIKFTRRCDYIVFVVPEIGTDWGSPVNHLEMRSFQLLMNTLSKQRVVVVLKLRHGELISTIGQRWPRSLIFQKVPWTWLARACDVTIQTESSIGIEAVSELRIPLAIWNPYSRIYSSHQWLGIAEMGVKEISDPATLMAELAQLSMEKPPQGIFSQFYADSFLGAFELTERVAETFQRDC